jgi:hypothetical protein
MTGGVMLLVAFNSFIFIGHIGIILLGFGNTFAYSLSVPFLEGTDRIRQPRSGSAGARETDEARSP